MAEIISDLKLSTVNLCGNSNATPQPTHSDSCLIITSNVALSGVDSGKTCFIQDNSGGPITITLPGTSNLCLGTRFTLVQEGFNSNDSLIIRTLQDNEYFSTGSYVRDNTTDNTILRPSNDIKNIITATGAATNCSHSIGTVIECQIITRNKWLIQVNNKVLGNGNDTYSFGEL
jgi:hypothetical protein